MDDNTVRLTSWVGIEPTPKTEDGNRIGDVVSVGFLLNKFIGSGNLPGVSSLITGVGKADQALISAIKQFQREIVGLTRPDGRVDPNGKTIKYLNGPVEARGGKTIGEPVAPTKSVQEAREAIARTARQFASQGGHFLFGSRGDMPGLTNGHPGRPGYTRPALFMESSHPSGLGPAVKSAWAITPHSGMIGCTGETHDGLKDTVDRVGLDKKLAAYLTVIRKYKDQGIDAQHWPGFDQFLLAQARMSAAHARHELLALVQHHPSMGLYPRKWGPGSPVTFGVSCLGVRHYDCIGFVNFVLSKVLSPQWATNMDWYRNQVSKPGKFTVTKFDNKSELVPFAEEGDIVLKEADSPHIGICTKNGGTIVVTNCRAAFVGMELNAKLKGEWTYLARLRAV